MDKNKLENVLKNIDPEKLNQIKTLLDGKKMDDVISEINIKKAGDALSSLNIDPKMLGGLLTQMKNNPQILNEIKNKLK